MPPWHADPAHGEFLNDARMPEEEKELFRQWVEAGVPEGDPADLPPPRKFSDGWQLPETASCSACRRRSTCRPRARCRTSISTSTRTSPKTSGCTRAEARPGNREVVHHLIMFYLPPDQEEFRPQDPLFNAVAAFAPACRRSRAPRSSRCAFPRGRS